MIKSTPTVSIVMPTYNVERYLPKAIESVLANAFQDWELLVVDDGSTDGSNKVAQSYAAKDDRIQVLKKVNGGLSDARNFGLAHAKGRYVHFFDSDDAVEPDFYERMVKAIEYSGFDLVICGIYKEYCSQSGKIVNVEKFMPNPISTPLCSNRSYRVLFDGFFYYAWNKLFRLSFLKKNELSYQKGLSIIEDQEFMLRFVQFNPSFSFIPYLGYHYIVRPRLTLGNRYSKDLIPCQLRSIGIKRAIFSKYCQDDEVLSRDVAKAAMSNARWMLTCLFSFSSDLSRLERYKEIKKIVGDHVFQENIVSYAPEGWKDKLLWYALKKKSAVTVYWFYLLRKYL